MPFNPEDFDLGDLISHKGPWCRKGQDHTASQDSAEPDRDFLEICRRRAQQRAAQESTKNESSQFSYPGR